MNDLERYDLDSDIGNLDEESQRLLLDLTQLWQARRHLRRRWTLRAKLSHRSLQLRTH